MSEEKPAMYWALICPTCLKPRAKDSPACSSIHLPGHLARLGKRTEQAERGWGKSLETNERIIKERDEAQKENDLLCKQVNSLIEKVDRCKQRYETPERVRTKAREG